MATPPVPDHGALVLVATPLGNLGDLSDRARAVLGAAALICCEDTRRTRTLLAASGLDSNPGRLWAVHAHNEHAMVEGVLDRVAAGALVAVASDAGMPGISDPGQVLVAAAHARDLKVSVVPGPSAVTSALVISGLPTGRYCFEGFLPRRGTARRAVLSALRTEERTTVLFEAPGRTASTLADLAAALGGARQGAVVRELTKVHEEVRRGSLADLAAQAELDPPRGEVVLVVAGAVAEPVLETQWEPELVAALERGERLRDVAVRLAATYGVDRAQVYNRGLALRAEQA